MSEPLIKRNPPADGSTMSIGGTNVSAVSASTSNAPTMAPRPAGQIEIAAPLEEGSRIGPYEVREHIGDGGMAAVYKVWHTGLHRFEALKIPRYQASRGPEADFLHRLLAEARTAASLKHPNIVGIHNVSDEKSVLHYFAMEFVAGDDLDSLIDNGALPFQEALTILQQIGSALDYAHANGVIHRDIKPANVLLEQTGSGPRARVVDFGISRAGEEDGSTRLTRSGMIVGTPEYMSPEQSGSGAPVDHRTDIYSLGVVAYEMLCGQPPFVAGDGVSRISVLMKQINEVPPPLDQCRPDLPPVAAQAVAKALAKNPEERFSSCAEFLEALAVAPPIEEQQAALLASGTRPLRRTVGALFGAPTLASGDKARTLNLDNETAFFATPIPSQIVRVVTSPISIITGLLGLLVGAFMVWNMRQPVNPTLLVKPEATPVMRPVIIKPEATAKPMAKPKSQPPKLTPIPVIKVKPTPATAKPLQKPTPRPMAKPIARAKATAKKVTQSVRKPAAKKPVAHRPIIRKPQTRTAVKARPAGKKRSAMGHLGRSGGEAGLPP